MFATSKEKLAFHQKLNMQTPVLVLDNGGSTIKAGLATADAPSA